MYIRTQMRFPNTMMDKAGYETRIWWSNPTKFNGDFDKIIKEIKVNPEYHVLKEEKNYLIYSKDGVYKIIQRDALSGTMAMLRSSDDLDPFAVRMSSIYRRFKT